MGGGDDDAGGRDAQSAGARRRHGPYDAGNANGSDVTHGAGRCQRWPRRNKVTDIKFFLEFLC